jgi:hypothetical protein
MHIQHIRNIHFTKLLKVNGRVREFNFRKLPGNDLFHIDVSDDRGNRIITKMQKTDNHWRFIDEALPAWLIESEKKLGEMIDEELSIA